MSSAFSILAGGLATGRSAIGLFPVRAGAIQRMLRLGIPSGNLTKLLKMTINSGFSKKKKMVIFNSYVKLPEGIPSECQF